MCVQLVDNEEGSETTALSRMGRQLRYMLSMGHRIHELEAAAPYTQVLYHPHTHEGSINSLSCRHFVSMCGLQTLRSHFA